MFNRTVVEENHYMLELYALADSFTRVLTVHDAVVWEISRRPDAGEPIQPGSSYRVYRTTAMGNTPSFTVLYLFDPVNDPNHVYLHGIRPNISDDPD